jgi:dihydrolipoamide dehydrogenase
MDGEVAKQFQRILEKQGFAFRLGTKVTGVDTSGKTLSAQIEPAAGGKSETLEADVVLVAIGRVPYTEGLGLRRPASRSTIAAASRSTPILRPA